MGFEEKLGTAQSAPIAYSAPKTSMSKVKDKEPKQE
jgi:hypothetical protein